jgi:hypothetical protein
VELVACNTTQLGKNGLTVRADVDIGVGRIEGDGLIRIEYERPCTGSALNAVECVGPFQRCQASLGIESERHIAVTSGRARRTIEQNLRRFVERIGASNAGSLPAPCVERTPF